MIVVVIVLIPNHYLSIYFKPPPVIITGRPKAILSLRFHLLYVGVVQFLNVLILTLLCVQFI